MGTKYRHEWKHEINAADRIAIRQRLRAVARTDPHAVDGKYLIRSLYFDDLKDRALREKIDGVNPREKFRIRYYNSDTSLIHLEKKCKNNGLCSKFSARITKDEAQDITDGRIEWMKDCDWPLIQELYVKIRNRGLQPKTSCILRSFSFSSFRDLFSERNFSSSLRSFSFSLRCSFPA